MYGDTALLAPVLLPLVFALAAYALRGRRARNAAAVLAACAELCVLALLFYDYIVTGEGKTLSIPGICGRDMLLAVDGFRLVFALLSALMWLCSALSEPFCLSEEKSLGRLSFFELITLGATVGIFLSADLFSTFIFFEIMSLASCPWVSQDETPGAMRAAATYLFVGVLGGMVMLMGLFLLYRECGTLVISQLAEAAAGADRSVVFAAAVCLLFGFGAKAGAFPLHFWLPRAYTAAPAPATALLSSMLSKTGVFGVIVISVELFSGSELWGRLLLIIAVITMLTGALMGIFSTNLKRTLACSSMSQIGFILVGVAMTVLLGEHAAIAARGTILHMINHSLIKMLLFSAAGMLYRQYGSYELNELRGVGRGRPLLMLCFAVAALSVGGVPLFGGYVSKTLIHESIVEYIHLLRAAGESSLFFNVVEWLFIFAGGCTLAYMSKVFAAIFVEKPLPTVQKERSAGALVFCIPALLLMAIGLVPGITADFVADMTQGFMTHAHTVDLAYFSLINLKGAAYSICIGAVLYFAFVRLFTIRNGSYVNLIPDWLDLEKLVYRPLIGLVGMLLSAVAEFLDKCILDPCIKGLRLLMSAAAIALDSYILEPCIVAARTVMTVLAKLLDQYILLPLISGSAALGRGFSSAFNRLTHRLGVLAREAAHRTVAPEERIGLRIRLIHLCGVMADCWVRLMNATLWRRSPRPLIYKKSMDELAKTNFTSTHIVVRSMSFGLLMVCFGICVTLFYILIASRHLK